MTPSMFLIDVDVIGDRAQFLPLISTSWLGLVSDEMIGGRDVDEPTLITDTVLEDVCHFLCFLFFNCILCV